MYACAPGAKWAHACTCCAQIKQGEVFRSDTDTEVIPKLCNYIYLHSPERLPFNEVRYPWALYSG